MKVDVLIIGSGISSLTCAALLAKKGKSVVVLEQYSKVGGYLHCFNRFGQRFDTGAHYVGAMGPQQPFRAMLEYLGVYDDSLFVPLDPSGFDVFLYPGLQIKLPQGYENVISELLAHFPNERTAITSYFSKVRETVRHFPTYEFNDGTSTLLLEMVETPLMQVVESLTSNPALQSVFYSYCSLHAVKPEDVGFGFHAIVTDSLIRGPYGLKSGGDAIAQKFVQKIESHGGQVLTRHRVSQMITQEQEVKSVVTENGKEFHADWVISGIHPKSTLRLMSDQKVFTPAFRARVEGLKESMGLFGVYGVCKSQPDFNPLRNYYFFDTLDPRGIFRDPVLGEAPSAVFMSSPKRNHEAAENYPLSLHAASPYSWFAPWATSRIGKRPPEYHALKNQFASQMISAVEKYSPGFSSLMNRFETSSPLSNLFYNGSEEGSAYGIYHSTQNTGARALGPRTKATNLLLTGQNCLFPGLLGAATAALRTSGHIIGIKSLLTDLVKQRDHL